MRDALGRSIIERSFPSRSGAQSRREIEMERDGDMDTILQLVKDRASLDLSRYKRTSVERSIARRMRVRGIAEVSEYASFLTRDSEELQILLS